MAVLWVREVFDNREGVLASQQDTDVRTFLVMTNNKLDNAKTIENSGMIPLRFSPHPTRLSIFADEIRTRQDAKSGFRWFTTITYRSNVTGLPSLPAQEFQPDPLLRPAIISGRSVNAHKALTQGYPLREEDPPAEFSIRNGVQYMTESELVTRGGRYLMPIEPTLVDIQSSSCEAATGLQDDKMEFVFHVTYNVSPPLPIALLNLQNKVNVFPVVILGSPYAQRTLRFKGLAFSELLRENHNLLGPIFYYKVSFDLHYNPDTWLRAIADRGLLRFADDGKRTPILKKGSDIHDPVYLNGLGQPITDFTAAGQVKYGWYLPESARLVDFNFLPLNPPPPTSP